MNKVLAIVCACAAFSIFSPAREFTGLQQFVDPGELVSGKVQVFDYDAGKNRTYRVGAVRIDAAPAVVRGLLEDLENLGRSLPHIEYYLIRHRVTGAQGSAKGEILVEGRFSLSDFPAQYTIALESDWGNLWRKWRILTPDEVESYNRKGIHVLPTSGLIRNLEGFEYLQSVDGGAKTVYYYALNLTSTIPLPESVTRTIERAVFVERLSLIKKMAESGH